MDEGHNIEHCCIICKKGFEKEKPVVVSRKGTLTLLRFSEKHGRLELAGYLNELISTTPMRTILVHKICRRDFTDVKRIHENVELEEDVKVPCTKRLRSSLLPFYWEKDCMLCGKSAETDPRHPERKQLQVHKVITIPLRENILEQCTKRGNLWASELQDRLQIRGIIRKSLWP